MQEISEEMYKSILDDLNNGEEMVLPLAKGIMDKVCGYFIQE